MIKKKSEYIIIGILVICILLCGCSDTKSGDHISNQSNISVADSDGNTLSFPSPPQRIVITGGNIAEVLVMIGAHNQIVGVGDTIKNDPQLSHYLSHADSIGDYSVPNYEKIISLKPDLLLCYSSDKPKNLEALKKIGVPVGYFDCYKQNRLSEEVRKIGILTGNKTKADKLADFIDSIHKMIKEKVKDIPGSERPEVYYETGTDFTAAATNSGGDWLITTAGGRNIAENTSIQWVKVTPEWIILQNPDVIIKLGADDNTSTIDSTWNSFLNRKGFNLLKAVQTNQTYVISHDILYGPRSVLGLIYIAKIIHPERFADINPDQFLDRFTAEFFPEANQSRVIYPSSVNNS